MLSVWRTIFQNLNLFTRLPDVRVCVLDHRAESMMSYLWWLLQLDLPMSMWLLFGTNNNELQKVNMLIIGWTFVGCMPCEWREITNWCILENSVWFTFTFCYSAKLSNIARLHGGVILVLPRQSCFNKISLRKAEFLKSFDEIIHC